LAKVLIYKKKRSEPIITEKINKNKKNAIIKTKIKNNLRKKFEKKFFFNTIFQLRHNKKTLKFFTFKHYGQYKPF
jgi:hypothetical protein